MPTTPIAAAAPASLRLLLDALLRTADALSQARFDGEDALSQHELEMQMAARYGLPVAWGRIDYTDLPTYGGDEPRNTAGVWSWDADNLLVGEGSDLLIIPRDEPEGEDDA